MVGFEKIMRHISQWDNTDDSKDNLRKEDLRICFIYMVIWLWGVGFGWQPGLPLPQAQMKGFFPYVTKLPKQWSKKLERG